MVRFTSRLAIVLGCLGLMLALVHAGEGNSDDPGPTVGNPTQKLATCKKQPCKEQVTITRHEKCGDGGGQNFGDCKFDTAPDNLLWCEAVTDKASYCRLKADESVNQCKGYCSTDSMVPCYTGEWKVCIP